MRRNPPPPLHRSTIGHKGTDFSSQEVRKTFVAISEDREDICGFDSDPISDVSPMSLVADGCFFDSQAEGSLFKGD